jgi:hypothetical protein
MKNEELRHVKYKGNDRKEKSGFFHLWVIRRDSESKDEYAYALIESEKGEMMQIIHYDMQFMDRKSSK